MRLPLLSSRIVFLAVMAFFCLPATSQVKGAGAREAWLGGYEKLEQARQAEDAGRDQAAIALYGSAKKIFTDVKSRYPNWNPTLLRYRIKFCDDRIQALREKIESGVKTLSKNDLLRLHEKQQKKWDELRQAYQGQKRELAATSEALERARREAARNAAAREQTESLLREKQALANQITFLTQATDRLKKELEDARQDKRGERRANMLADRLKVMEAQKAEQEENLAAARKHLAALSDSTGALAAERQKLKGDLLTQTTALRDTAARLTVSEKNVIELTRQLGEARTRVAVANKQSEAMAGRFKDKELENKTQAAALADLEKKLRDVQKTQTGNSSPDLNAQKRIAALNQLIKEKDERLDNMSGELTMAREKADSLGQQAARAQTMAQTRIAQSVKLSNQMQSLRADRQTNMKTIAELQARLASLSQGNSGAATTVEHQKKQIVDLQGAADRAARQAAARLNLLRRQEDEIKTLGQKLDKLTRENSALRGRPRPAEQSPKVSALKKDLQNALTETEYHRQEAADAKKDLQNALAKAESYRQQAAEAETARRKLADNLLSGTGKTIPADQAQKAIEDRLKAELAAADARLAELKKQGGVAPSGQPGTTGQPQTAKSIFPRNSARVSALLHKGVQAEKEGNKEAAVWNYQKALTYQPRQEIALRRLGALSLASGDTTAAITYLNRAFYVDPDNVETLTQLGFAFMRNEQADMAFSMLSRAVALDADSPAVHTQLGVACSSLGWRDAAEVQFRRALKQDNHYPEAAFNLALLLAAEKDGARMDEARKWYQTARDTGTAADARLDQFFHYSSPSKGK